MIDISKKRKKAETEAQRKRRGVANPQRTQEMRDRAASLRYMRKQKHPKEVEAILLEAGWKAALEQVCASQAIAAATKKREDAIAAVLDNCVHNFSAAKIRVRSGSPSFYEAPESLAAFSVAINNLRQAQSDLSEKIANEKAANPVSEEAHGPQAHGEGAAMLYVQQQVLGNPMLSPAQHAQWLREDIAGAEPGSELAAIGETLARFGIEAAIEEVLLQEAQSIQFMNEDVLPCEPIDARTMREITGRALPLRAVK
ncbi:hypothetical protein [Bradyrhizobium erythrophlei]|uniref:Uncharacterized protein n=1 Tax=Bradyrhizobium erythrophlei TaxID=1437360 RepID=A0A1M5XWZ1_9BRAD|nr:hypothetical protein [Bradyrhizobium erythrophlei]SHI04337.1 hypothetical protein SAMN05443248_7696 [Bradyrhizobium erythrophlei]